MLQRKLQNESNKLETIPNTWATQLSKQWNKIAYWQFTGANPMMWFQSKIINLNGMKERKKNIPLLFFENEHAWEKTILWKHKDGIPTSMAIINTKVRRRLVQIRMSCMLASHVEELKLISNKFWYNNGLLKYKRIKVDQTWSTCVTYMLITRRGQFALY